MNRKIISNSNYVLRKVLNSKDCLDIIKNFIESLLETIVEDIELNPYLNKRKKYLPKEENFGVVDVRIRTKENEEINVGIQFIDGIHYIQTKMLLYYAQIHLNQLEYNNKREYVRTLTINMIDYNIFSSSNYYKIIKIKSEEDKPKLEELELHTIEFPKFECNNIKNMSDKEKWIAFLKGTDEKITQELKQDNKYIAKLDELLEKYWLEEKLE